MKLTKDGRRELHGEIMLTIRGRMMTSKFTQDITEVVTAETADGNADYDELCKWENIVRKEVEKVIDKVLKRLQSH